MEAFSEVCARALRTAGLTQDALARKIGVARPTLTQWISGTRPVPSDRMDALADGLGLTGVEREQLILTGLLVKAPPALVARVARLVDGCGAGAWGILLDRSSACTQSLSKTKRRRKAKGA